MAFLIIHRHMMSNHKTINPFNNPHPILRVHRNFMLVSTNPNTCLQRTSRTLAQVQQMFTHVFHAIVALLKITMTSPHTKAVNNFSKFQAARHHQPQQAINNNSQARRMNGIFHHIILITPTFTLPHTIITIQRYRIHIMDIISIKII